MPYSIQGATPIKNTHPTFVSLAMKTIVVHSVTYFLCGLFAYLLLDYEHAFAQANVRTFMRQTSERIVMAGPLFQPIRGFLFAIAFFPLSSALFSNRRGWLTMWTILVIVGILSTFGPSPGSIEGMIYTTFPIKLQLIGLSEVLAQSLLLSLLLCYWVNHPENRLLTCFLISCFVIVMLLPALGLAFGPTTHTPSPALAFAAN